jgi:hypothetical protein
LITILRELFNINRPLVFFVYGQVFFVLGLAIARSPDGIPVGT